MQAKVSAACQMTCFSVPQCGTTILHNSCPFSSFLLYICTARAAALASSCLCLICLISGSTRHHVPVCLLVCASVCLSIRRSGLKLSVCMSISPKSLCLHGDHRQPCLPCLLCVLKWEACACVKLHFVFSLTEEHQSSGRTLQPCDIS